MLFMEALEQMKAGHRVARDSWKDEEGNALPEYLVIMPNVLYIWKLVYNIPNAGNWLPSVADLCADDWKVL